MQVARTVAEAEWFCTAMGGPVSAVFQPGAEGLCAVCGS